MFQSFIVLKVYEFIFDLANSQFLKHFNIKGNKFLESWINLLFDDFMLKIGIFTSIETCAIPQDIIINF